MRKEKRQNMRVSTADSVANCRFLSAESGGKFQFTVWPVRNISQEGAAVLSEEEVSNGALAFLNIDLDVIMKTIGVIAKVVWCKKYSQKYEIGLNFSWWPKEEDKQIVADFIGTKSQYEEKINQEKKILEAT